ncbi:flagellar motor protein MotS [Ammoniphilus sp. CFH 90114]|uniref:flagellar motor protein MotS n=1 Tax=Ammoniphilus sp. CFH 90114 TaxID=2493665 RepID=UPI00100F7DCB|nr:flagellar motor protein MotS [Ammoniphilus sp. CFH 90114]RXT08151.1 flagellar motor protein MotB [Ammoniphilus sp. CFH 90114]
MRRKKKDPPKGAPMWMTTFSDLMTLILVFFVLLFAFSELDAKKFRAFLESFTNNAPFEYNQSIIEFDTQGKMVRGEEVKEEPNDQTGQATSVSEQQIQKRNQEQLDEITKKVQEFLKENQLETNVQASRTPLGVELILQDGLLFRSGEAEILPNGVPFLNKLAELFQTLPNQIIVEGHTDNQPISNLVFPSNWELSAARSSRVVRFFIERHKLKPDRFVAMGYADTRPVTGNGTPEGRQKNRRVVIAIAGLEK